jgi:hypothetical protein
VVQLVYSPGRFWWEVQSILRRAGIVAALVFLSQRRTLRFALAALMCTVFFCVHLVMQPSSRRGDNQIESLSLAALALIAFY